MLVLLLGGPSSLEEAAFPRHLHQEQDELLTLVVPWNPCTVYEDHHSNLPGSRGVETFSTCSGQRIINNMLEREECEHVSAWFQRQPYSRC